MCGSGTGTLSWSRMQYFTMVVAGRENLLELPGQAAYFDQLFQLWQMSAQIAISPV